MLGRKGNPSGKFGQKGVPAFNLIGAMRKDHDMNNKKTMREMVAKANKYGALEKK